MLTYVPTLAMLTLASFAAVLVYDSSGITREQLAAANIELVEGDSGPPCRDQVETSWSAIARESGSGELLELTSATGLPRRPFTFSRANVDDAIRYNRTSDELYLSLNFANYVDHDVYGSGDRSVKSPKLQSWLDQNLRAHLHRLKFIGTGPFTNHMIQLD